MGKGTLNPFKKTFYVCPKSVILASIVFSIILSILFSPGHVAFKNNKTVTNVIKGTHSLIGTVFFGYLVYIYFNKTERNCDIGKLY